MVVTPIPMIAQDDFFDELIRENELAGLRQSIGAPDLEAKVDRLEIFVLTVTERIAMLERRLVCHRRRLANSRARRKAQR